MKRQAGFSLVEVMCAILVMGVGLVGLTVGISTALTSSKESEHLTLATLLAEGRLETLRAEGYLVEGSDSGKGEDALAGYEWTQSVSPTDVEGLFEVSVAVSRLSTGREVCELKTLLFDPPVYSTLDDTDQREKRTSDLP